MANNKGAAPVPGAAAFLRGGYRGGHGALTFIRETRGVSLEEPDQAELRAVGEAKGAA